jgi:hypothetical protein
MQRRSLRTPSYFESRHGDYRNRFDILSCLGKCKTSTVHSTLYHTLRKRQTTDLLVGSRLIFISLLLTNTVLLVQSFLIIWWGRLHGTQKKTIVGLLVFNPLWLNLVKYPIWTEICRNDDIEKHPCNKIKIELWG